MANDFILQLSLFNNIHYIAKYFIVEIFIVITLQYVVCESIVSNRKKFKFLIFSVSLFTEIVYTRSDQ